MDLKNYKTPPRVFDEMLTDKNRARPGLTALVNYLRKMKDADMTERSRKAEMAIRTMGITFTVYSEGENIDREWPFDIIPRAIHESEWRTIEKGLRQRLTALNLFITDIYNDEKIINI